MAKNLLICAMFEMIRYAKMSRVLAGVLSQQDSACCEEDIYNLGTDTQRPSWAHLYNMA